MKKIIICDHCDAINRIAVDKLNSTKPICGKCSTDLNTNPKIRTITFEKLETIARHAQLPILVDAYADWCGPCKMYGPIFQQAGELLWKEAEFFKIDTEKNPMLSVKYGIRGIPMTLVFKNNQLINTQSGVLQQEHIQALIQATKNS
ncbi:thioredoxin family protein [Halobacteriovorax sp.]|uniref:thioredoxin family protein n=1 Tax=Halobacteriovorax sp. TaxID=2020862 RepID=UPI003AF2A645